MITSLEAFLKCVAASFLFQPRASCVNQCHAVGCCIARAKLPNSFERIELIDLLGEIPTKTFFAGGSGSMSVADIW
jgi:hypothetical protein